MTIKQWRFLLMGWMAFIFFASSDFLSADHTGEILVYSLLNVVVRKSAHMIEYGILMFLWFRSLWTVPERFQSAVIWSIVLSVLYAASDEWHQTFVPSRSGTWVDVVWDGAGAVLMGFVLCYLYTRHDGKIKQLVLGSAVQTRV